MCYIWKNPTLPKEEITLETLEKIPEGIDYLNLTGGEPTLRKDLMDIVDLLHPKAMKLEISSNGMHTNRLEPVIRKYPDVKIRLSLDGLETTNNTIRGEKDGFSKKVNGLHRLKELGGQDLGFAITIQDKNSTEAVKLFQYAHTHGFELATSTLHNGFQFHKSDNIPYDRLRIAKDIENLIIQQLDTYNVKNWFRAYINLGLIAKVLGHPRIIRCTAATDFVFIDPWSDVFACNVRPDLKMGNLEHQPWDEILTGSKARHIRDQVYGCAHNCWMVGSAKTAMRHPKYAKIPKGGPALWVMINKLRVMLGLPVEFERYIDYSQIHTDDNIPLRVSYLDQTVKRTVQAKEDNNYDHYGDFFNI